jgi:primosomal protein N'
MVNYYNVCLNQPTSKLEAVYTYSSTEKLALGVLVQISFNHQKSVGIITALCAKPTIPRHKILPIVKVLNNKPIVTANTIALAKILSRYYLTSVGEVLFAMIPATEIARTLTAPLHYAKKKHINPIIFYEGSFGTRLLHYATNIHDCLNHHQQVIIIFPVRRLASYAAHYFASVFGQSNVCNINHAADIDTIRSNYRKIAQNQIKIIIGSRKTIFTPVYSLGLIIIDQPQNFAFFNDQKPAYWLRTVAAIIHDSANIPLLFGDHTLDTESLYLAKYKKLIIRRYAKSTAPVTWFEGPLRQILNNLRSKLFLVVVPFIRGMSLVCPFCQTALMCPQCRTALTAEDGQAVCLNKHRLPLSPCPKCHNIFPINAQFTPEAIVEKLPHVSHIILSSHKASHTIPKHRPLAIIASAKITDYPDLLVDETVIIGADHWLSFANPKAKMKFLELFWQLRAQTHQRIIIHTARPLPELLEYVNRKSSHVLLELMLQNYKLNLPPFYHQIQIKTPHPNRVKKLLSDMTKTIIEIPDGVIFFMSRKKWPILSPMLDELYKLATKITIDKP